MRLVILLLVYACTQTLQQLTNSFHRTPWMNTHSLVEEEGKLHTLEYYVSKASELNDMMDPSKGTTGHVIYTVSEVHKDDEHFGKHVELGQGWDRINEFLGTRLRI